MTTETNLSKIDFANMMNAKPEKEVFDFDVTRCPVFSKLPNGEVVTLSGRSTLVRTDTNEVLGQVSKSYQIVQHQDAVNLIRESVGKLGFDYEESSEVTKGGSRLFHTMRMIGQDIDIEGQSVAPQVVLINSYDRSHPLDIDLGAYRMVCSNGMRVGKTFQRVSHKHTANLSLELMVKKIELKLESFKTVLIPFWNALAEYDMTMDQGSVMIEQINKNTKFGGRNSEAVNNEWRKDRSEVTAGRNAWGLYNAYTSVITHKIQENSFERGHNLSEVIVPSFNKLVTV